MANDQRIVHLDRLTSREVGEWFKTNDMIIVPHGPISGHGAWTTLGMHPHGAEAVAVLLARKLNALVFPTIHTCFGGATTLYPGSMPFSYEYHIKALKDVCRLLIKQGFGRIVLLCFTHPEATAGTVVARDLYDESQMPVVSLVAAQGFESEGVNKLVENYAGSAGEAIVDYAAMKILGYERPIAEPDLARKGLPGGHDRPAELRPLFKTIGPRGTRGWFYQNEREHSSHGTIGLTHEGKSDLELGVKIVEALADWLMPAIDAFNQHLAWCKAHPAPARLPRQDVLPE